MHRMLATQSLDPAVDPRSAHCRCPGLWLHNLVTALCAQDSHAVVAGRLVVDYCHRLLEQERACSCRHSFSLEGSQRKRLFLSTGPVTVFVCNVAPLLIRVHVTRCHSPPVLKK